jgi:phytoene dehydrogenase-like protein
MYMYLYFNYLGSGTSGLTCGALLSKIGYKVLILE